MLMCVGPGRPARAVHGACRALRPPACAVGLPGVSLTGKNACGSRSLYPALSWWPLSGPLRPKRSPENSVARSLRMNLMASNSPVGPASGLSPKGNQNPPHPDRHSCPPLTQSLRKCIAVRLGSPPAPGRASTAKTNYLIVSFPCPKTRTRRPMFVQSSFPEHRPKTATKTLAAPPFRSDPPVLAPHQPTRFLIPTSFFP